MVKLVLHCGMCGAIFALLCSQLHARELADYRLGDKLDTDVMASERITVVNPEATETLREKEAEKVPVICRYYPGMAGEAEAALHKAIAEAKGTFLKSVESNFKQRTLDIETTASPVFRQLVSAFNSRNAAFPLTTELAVQWALGGGDEPLEEGLAQRLRDTMKRPIRPYGMPDGLKLTYTVRLVALTNRDETPTTEIIESRSRNVTRTNLITLPWAKNKLQDSFPEAERVWGKFIAGFVKENCFPDAQLTQQARAKRTGHLQVADTYQAGQLIAKRGDVIDARIMAALARLVEQATARTVQSAETTARNAMRERDRWMAVTLGVGGFVAVLVIWGLRRRRAVSMLPTLVSEGPVVPSDTRGLRAAVAPHLARLLSGKLFRRLLSQREQMIATQEEAASELAEMEAQLEKVRTPIEERLRAYERRIADLEKELLARGEENEALLKAKIGMIRKQLEQTRAKGRIELN